MSNTAEVNIAGAPFKPVAISKQMDGKFSMENSVTGMGTLVNQKFDRDSAYAEQLGMKLNKSEKEVAKL